MTKIIKLVYMRKRQHRERESEYLLHSVKVIMQRAMVRASLKAPLCVCVCDDDCY